MSINFSIIPGVTLNKIWTVDQDLTGYTAHFHFGDYTKGCTVSGSTITLSASASATEDFLQSGPYRVDITSSEVEFTIQGFITIDQTGFGASISDNSGAVVSTAIGPAVQSGGFLSGLIVQTTQIGSGAIRSGHIASGQIGTYHIASGVLSNFSLTSGAVVSGSLGNAVVFSGNIGSGQIGANHIAAGVIPAAFSLTSGIVTSGHIASGQIGNNHLASGAVKVSSLGSGIPVLNNSTIQLFNSGNIFRGAVIEGWSSGGTTTAPTGGRLLIKNSDWFGTNAVCEFVANSTVLQIGHYNDNGIFGVYNRSVITNVSASPIEVGPNDYSTSKVGIGAQGTSMSGKLTVQPNSGMVAISVKNAAHNKDMLQLADASGNIRAKFTSSGELTTTSVNCNTLVRAQNIMCSGSEAYIYYNNSVLPDYVPAFGLFWDSNDGQLKCKDQGGNVGVINVTYA